ncbi:DUF6890 family protein [Hahella chejuensis]
MPGQDQDEQVLGFALFLETDFWKRQEIAVANGIAKALKG